METPLLQAHIKSCGFNPSVPPVLRDIRLTVTPGEFILLLGPTDSGKSVLGRCLAGVIPLSQEGSLEGTIYLNGQKTTSKRLVDLASLVSLITDDPHNQLFCPTLIEDLAFGPCNLELFEAEVRQRVQQALYWVGLAGFEHRRPETLSGGEAQRAALASFLTLASPLMILDRATGQMDLEAKTVVYRILAKLCREEGKSVIIMDDNFMTLLPLASRIIFLNKGSIVYDGAPDRMPSEQLESLCPPHLPPPVPQRK